METMYLVEGCLTCERYRVEKLFTLLSGMWQETLIDV